MYTPSLRTYSHKSAIWNNAENIPKRDVSRLGQGECSVHSAVLTKAAASKMTLHASLQVQAGEITTCGVYQEVYAWGR